MTPSEGKEERTAMIAEIAACSLGSWVLMILDAQGCVRESAHVLITGVLRGVLGTINH